MAILDAYVAAKPGMPRICRTPELLCPAPANADRSTVLFSRIAMDEGWGDAGNMWLWHQRIGGNPRLMIVTPFENFAAMEPPQPSFFDFLSEHAGSAEEAGSHACFDA